MFSLYLAHLWKLTNDSKLKNKNGETWNFQENFWTLPDVCKEGEIKVLGKNILMTRMKNESKMETEVNLQNENITMKKQQNWIRGPKDEEEWFTIKSSSSDLYLSLKPNGKLIMEGRYFNDY